MHLTRLGLKEEKGKRCTGSEGSLLGWIWMADSGMVSESSHP
jgi:hypothetical protein